MRKSERCNAEKQSNQKWHVERYEEVQTGREAEWRKYEIQEEWSHNSSWGPKNIYYWVYIMELVSRRLMPGT